MKIQGSDKMMSSVEMNVFCVSVYCIAAVQCNKALYAVLVKTVQYVSTSI